MGESGRESAEERAEGEREKETRWEAPCQSTARKRRWWKRPRRKSRPKPKRRPRHQRRRRRPSPRSKLSWEPRLTTRGSRRRTKLATVTLATTSSISARPRRERRRRTASSFRKPTARCALASGWRSGTRRERAEPSPEGTEN